MTTEKDLSEYCKENKQAHELATAYMEECQNEFVEQDELAFNSFIAGFKQASEMSEWVSVDDRLPEVETWVSSYIKGEYQKVKLRMFKGNLRWTYFDKSCIYYQSITEVTHWMPLPPQPPKQR